MITKRVIEMDHLQVAVVTVTIPSRGAMFRWYREMDRIGDLLERAPIGHGSGRLGGATNPAIAGPAVMHEAAYNDDY